MSSIKMYKFLLEKTILEKKILRDIKEDTNKKMRLKWEFYKLS